MVTARSVPPLPTSPEGELHVEYIMSPTDPEMRCTHPPLRMDRKTAIELLAKAAIELLSSCLNQSGLIDQFGVHFCM